MPPEALGRAVRAARRAQGLRQTDLAALAGVGTRFLSDLENGKPTAELGRVLQVIDSLGLELQLEPRSWRSLGLRDAAE